ncbi:MAG: molybdopterin-containing oxidoreductase family protein, partial [Chloroflexota bacterium]
NRLTLGAASEVADVAHARYLLNFGGNPYETHPAYVPFVQRLTEARMSGAKLVTFDPRLSLTAGRSDEWFPVLPGSDTMVLLAMANVVIQQKLHDREFLSRWTDLSPEQLAGQLAAYTPEAAEAASGMRADDLRRIATEFARTRPGLALVGGGIGRQQDAVDTQRAAILLNALVGSAGARGGYCPAPTVAFPEPEPVPPALPDSSLAAGHVEGLIRGERSVGLYMTCLANPAYSWPDSEAFRAVLQDESRVPYVVAIDTNLTETSLLADLVLPAATYLESWGLESPPAQSLVPFVALRQPVVPPRGESLSVDDILLTLGTRLDENGSRHFPFPTVESYLNAVISRLPELSAAGGLSLLRGQGVWYDMGGSPQHRSSKDSFPTASGKLEFGAIGAPRAGGEGRRVQVSAAEPASDTADLILVTYRPNVHFGDYSANCWWLSEIAHRNALLINPAAARQRGIEQGQRVKVTSQVGTLEVQVRITQGIHPRVVALASGFGHEGIGRVARAEGFKSDDAMTQLIWWEGQGNGVNASTLVSGLAGESGGLVWGDTRVTVEAAG